MTLTLERRVRPWDDGDAVVPRPPVEPRSLGVAAGRVGAVLAPTSNRLAVADGDSSLERIAPEPDGDRSGDGSADAPIGGDGR